MFKKNRDHGFAVRRWGQSPLGVGRRGRERHLDGVALADEGGEPPGHAVDGLDPSVVLLGGGKPTLIVCWYAMCFLWIQFGR